MLSENVKQALAALEVATDWQAVAAVEDLYVGPYGVFTARLKRNRRTRKAAWVSKDRQALSEASWTVRQAIDAKKAELRS